MIEAVIFDWGGTLTPWKTVDPAEAWRRYAAAVPGADAVALAEADAAAWLVSKETAKAFHLREVVAAVGAADDEAGWTAFRGYWEFATWTDPQVRPMLEELRGRGLRTGVLSSTSWPARWHLDHLERDGVAHLFDGCVWSSDLPWTKPHPEAFAAAMAAVGVTEPGRCVYVGDRPYDDITGAKAAGMHAVLVPHSDIPLEQQVPTDVEPDAVLHQLADLPAVLDKLDTP